MMFTIGEFAVSDKKHISDWRVMLMDSTLQFYKKGVRIGWRLVKINGYDLLEGSEEVFRDMIKSGDACTIVFEVPPQDKVLFSPIIIIFFCPPHHIATCCAHLIKEMGDRICRAKQEHIIFENEHFSGYFCF